MADAWPTCHPSLLLCPEQTSLIDTSALYLSLLRFLCTLHSTSGSQTLPMDQSYTDVTSLKLVFPRALGISTRVTQGCPLKHPSEFLVTLVHANTWKEVARGEQQSGYRGRWVIRGDPGREGQKYQETVPLLLQTREKDQMEEHPWKWRVLGCFRKLGVTESRVGHAHCCSEVQSQSRRDRVSPAGWNWSALPEVPGQGFACEDAPSVVDPRSVPSRDAPT